MVNATLGWIIDADKNSQSLKIYFVKLDSDL